MAPRVLEYKLTAALRTLQEVAQALESVLEGRGEKKWRADLAAGFAEGFRVLREGGTLLFKWAETQIKVSEVLKLTEQKPLIATRFPTKSGTHWIVFYKEEA